MFPAMDEKNPCDYSVVSNKYFLIPLLLLPNPSTLLPFGNHPSGQAYSPSV